MTPLAFLIRYGDNDAISIYFFWTIFILGFILKTVAVYVFGFYRWSWHRVDLRDMTNLLIGISVVTLVLFMVRAFYKLPSLVLVIEFLFSVIVLSSVRILAKIIRERSYGLEPNRSYVRALVVGNDTLSTQNLCSSLRNPKTGYIPVGIVLSDKIVSKRLFGIPVLGSVENLAELLRMHHVEEVILSERITDKNVFRELIKSCNRAKISCKIVEGWENIALLQLAVRPVNIEDLMYREPLGLDHSRMQSFLTGKTVLVTGAGGSIGLELVRQVAQFGPATIVLLGRGENSIYTAESELKRKFPNLQFVSVIADVRNCDKLEHVFKQYQPKVVFHAAAHKHVPLMEANPDEAIFNNVIGTKNVASLSAQYGVLRFVNISTDKAVNPTSVMGASKRLAEYIVCQVGKRCMPNQSFVSVRFGNVLGSRGSVVPIFNEQIQKRLPIQVTHPEMRRYFMTIPEAAQLVLQAAGFSENGNVYVLDMGEPIKIVDLAKDLILLAGLDPNVDIPIVYTGIRPGEKLYEELLNTEEGVVSSPYNRIFVARNNAPQEDYLEILLDELMEASLQFDASKLKQILQSALPTLNLTNE